MAATPLPNVQITEVANQLLSYCDSLARPELLDGVAHWKTVISAALRRRRNPTHVDPIELWECIEEHVRAGHINADLLRSRLIKLDNHWEIYLRLDSLLSQIYHLNRAWAGAARKHFMAALRSMPERLPGAHVQRFWVDLEDGRTERPYKCWAFRLSPESPAQMWALCELLSRPQK